MSINVPSVQSLLNLSNEDLIQKLKFLVQSAADEANESISQLQYIIEQTDSQKAEHDCGTKASTNLSYGNMLRQLGEYRREKESQEFVEWLRFWANQITMSEAFEACAQKWDKVKEVVFESDPDSENIFNAYVTLQGFDFIDEFELHSDAMAVVIKKLAVLLLCMEDE